MIDFIYDNGKFVQRKSRSALEAARETISELRLELAQVKAERDNWRAVAEVRGKTIEEYGKKIAEDEAAAKKSRYGLSRSEMRDIGVSIKTKMYR